MFPLIAGVAAGALHVVAGPDHLAAVAPLVTDNPRPSWRAGFQWGLGHTTGVLAIGGLLLLFRAALPIEAIAVHSERLVGVSLVALGAWSAWRAAQLTTVRRHDHPHRHGPVTGASFGMGALHGLAGSSHLFGVLPALMMSPSDGRVYLAGFGVGAIMAMTAYAWLLGLVVRAGQRRGVRTHRGLLYACSLAAFVVGGMWLVA